MWCVRLLDRNTREDFGVYAGHFASYTEAREWADRNEMSARRAGQMLVVAPQPE